MLLVMIGTGIILCLVYGIKETMNKHRQEDEE
jgi:hypothetical protein